MVRWRSYSWIMVFVKSVERFASGVIVAMSQLTCRVDPGFKIARSAYSRERQGRAAWSILVRATENSPVPTSQKARHDPGSAAFAAVSFLAWALSSVPATDDFAVRAEDLGCCRILEAAPCLIDPWAFHDGNRVRRPTKPAVMPFTDRQRRTAKEGKRHQTIAKNALPPTSSSFRGLGNVPPDSPALATWCCLDIVRRR